MSVEFFQHWMAWLPGLAALIICLVLLSRMNLQLRRLRQQCALQETAILSLRGALSALCSDEMGVDQRQTLVERKLKQLSEQQQQLLMRDPESGPYMQAIRLAQKGASKEEIMSTCGLTRGEVELIASLHGGDSPRRAT
ncbi:MAG: DUF2802 domain-containing protein [Chromatiales bacterium]|jgi:hypothetical protein|nr:DUF2802 domain-containing protein [Chromatiales bacterium]